MDDSKINFKNVIYGCNLFHFHTNRRYEVSIQKRCTYHEKVFAQSACYNSSAWYCQHNGSCCGAPLAECSIHQPLVCRRMMEAIQVAIIALEGTTKIECTLTLYEKGFSETIRRYLRSVRLTTVLAMSLSVIMPLNPGQRTN